MALLKGFVAPTIGNYPPLYLLLAGAAVAVWGAVMLLRRPAGWAYPARPR